VFPASLRYTVTREHAPPVVRFHATKEEAGKLRALLGLATRPGDETPSGGWNLTAVRVARETRTRVARSRRESIFPNRFLPRECRRCVRAVVDSVDASIEKRISGDDIPGDGSCAPRVCVRAYRGSPTSLARRRTIESHKRALPSDTSSFIKR